MTGWQILWLSFGVFSSFVTIILYTVKKMIDVADKASRDEWRID